MLASADVLALHQHAGVTDSVIPSKLLTYMASGRPIVATSAARKRDTARDVTQAECGLAVEPENPAAFAGAILKLYEDSELRARCGASGRNFVAGIFPAKRCSRDWSLCSTTSPGSPSSGDPRRAGRIDR